MGLEGIEGREKKAGKSWGYKTPWRQLTPTMY